MAQPARNPDRQQPDRWSPAAAMHAVAVPTVDIAGDVAGNGPIADLHRMIEARLRGPGLPGDAGLGAIDVLTRRASRLIGWTALLGALAALAVLLT